MKTIEIELTEEQTKTINRYWITQGGYAHAMIGQPLYRNGSYKVIRIGVLNPEHADQVADVIALAKALP